MLYIFFDVKTFNQIMVNIFLSLFGLSETYIYFPIFYIYITFIRVFYFHLENIKPNYYTFLFIIFNTNINFEIRRYIRKYGTHIK